LHWRDKVTATVIAVACSAKHTMTKPTQDHIRLLAGLGVAGDAHAGLTVRHRSRVAIDPNAPNLRQVHLMHAELHDELCAAGFALAPGLMGENITTRGIDLLGLPTGTRLHIGERPSSGSRVCATPAPNLMRFNRASWRR